MKKHLPYLFLLPSSLFLFVAGCSRDDAAAPAPAASQAAPEVYMKDPEFRAKLKECNVSRDRLAKTRATVVERMEKMIEAKKKELGTSDEAKLKAELEKDPEWISLRERCVDANTAIDEDRRRTMRMVRERLTREEVKSKKEEGRRKK